MLDLREPEDGHFPGPVEFRKPRPGEMPHYQLADNQLAHGASLANRKIWVTTKSTGRVEQVFSCALGRSLLGSIVVVYALPSKTLISSAPETQCLSDDAESFVLLEQEGAGTFEIHPFMQKHIFDLSGNIHVEETILVPKESEDDAAVVLQHIEVTNYDSVPVNLLITVYAEMQGDLGDDLVAAFDEDLDALTVYNSEHPEWVRIVGAEGCATGYRTTRDVAEVYAGTFTRKIGEEHVLSGGSIGQLQLELLVRPGESARTTITAVITHNGMEEARRVYESRSNFDSLARATNDHFTSATSMSMVETPDPVINQGVFWAKVNMLKAMADYPEGPGFTNEPAVSSNVVLRDVAWYVYGCDFLDPDFSAKLLLKLAEKQYPSGKMPEYYDARDGRVEDYGISLNDDTPLFVLACCHHFSTTHDEEFLKSIYPNAKNAADYIMAQRDRTGMVVSKADGREVFGIASWRNVIPDYQINGAVTEINSECFAALRSMGNLAKSVGEHSAARHYLTAARRLRGAINQHLLNPDNGLYYLNIDSEGKPHTDVTADEIFPVLFDVAPENVAWRIMRRLRTADFLTSAGLRTASRNSPDYEPTTLIGLKGGVWPGVAFWYAFAASRTNPEFMVDSLHASYLHYLLDPLKNNTVPGQFSEWFDGESLVNRGMRLSPWEPPRLLWAAVEGLCGAKPTPSGDSVSPIMPRNWRWLALRRMPCGHGYLTYFATFHNDRIRIYANQEIKTRHDLLIVGEDVSHKVRAKDYRIHRAAFAREGVLTVCLGSEANVHVTAMLVLRDLLEPNEYYSVSVYSRVLGKVEIGTRTGEQLSDFAITIEDGEFRVVTLTKV